jgi:hypothetical protein
MQAPHYQPSSPSCWVSKLRELSLFDKPVCMTYYLEEGVKITASVIVKDKYTDSDGDFLILANGTLVPVPSVIDIFPHSDVEMPSNYSIPGNEEISRIFSY